ncbi:hypothetical protein TNCV_3528141 [Trichonephila clavipes]|nr:hypothetical protein TNCV_3528141 [Trichonephila clavipes]
MINDNGTQFVSEVFEHLSNRLSINHVKTVVYKPQSNITERINRDLLQTIASFVNDNHETWGPIPNEISLHLENGGQHKYRKNSTKVVFWAESLLPRFKIF